MKKNSLLYLFLFFIATGGVSAQPVERLKFKKDPSLIYFFHKGSKSDTLSRTQEHLFYLVTPDSLKKDLSIQVENAQLQASGNDSLLKLVFLPGFKYETFYIRDEVSAHTPKEKQPYKLTTMVDGTSVLPPSKITISLINKRTGGLILQNTYTYR